MRWFVKVREFGKLPRNYLWAVVVSSALFLFLPKSALKSLNVLQFVQNYGVCIGVVFILFLSLACVNTLTPFSHFIDRKRRHLKLKRARFTALQNLDLEEKAVLREFLIQGRDTIWLPIDHPTVVGMLTKGILTPISNYGKTSVAGRLLLVKEVDEVRGHLDLAMIDLPASEQPSKEQIDWVIQNRPNFMREIEQDIDVFHRSWNRWLHGA
ncbi:MAG TPA: super-infection exclusion protein B [Verrucomicrobiae bacterium]|nr:super-infection exclusion protein B [Verrucomicrobiae bacterium]